MPKPLSGQITAIQARLSAPFRNSPDQDGSFPSNGDRFAAQELAKRLDTSSFTRTGFLCQILAVGWHRKSAEQLGWIAEGVGRERIMVVHGEVDSMITVPHGEVLAEGLGVTKRVFEGRGHYLPLEEREAFRGLVEGIVERTERIR